MLDDVASALRVLAHGEADGLWAEVLDLPGCFAAGDTPEELLDSLLDAVSAYLDDGR